MGPVAKTVLFRVIGVDNTCCYHAAIMLVLLPVYNSYGVFHIGELKQGNQMNINHMRWVNIERR